VQQEGPPALTGSVGGQFERRGREKRLLLIGPAQDHAAVLRAAFGGRVVGQGLGLTESLRSEA
jgi:hypothetical protein